MFGGNILILLAYSVSSIDLLVVMCHIHHETELLHKYLAIFSVISGKISIFSSHKKF